MNDKIYRQVVIDIIQSYKKNTERLKEISVEDVVDMFEDMIDDIKNESSAQLERRKGEWIRNDNGTYSCSVCQSWIPEEQYHYAQYCLYCGAEMRENDNEK